MLGATALAILLALDFLIGRNPDHFSRLDGVLLLVCFALFLFLTTRTALRDRKKDQFLKEAERDQEKQPEMHWVPASLFTVAGLAGVLLGSTWTVDGASGVAAALGMSQALIGLTIVALGTSLPELTTSLFAVRKGQADLAIGNIVGSNIFNLLFILGVSSSIRAVPVPARGFADLAAMAVFSVVLLPFALSQRKLARHEGLLLLAGYLAYMAWRTLSTS
jgi:cation:H+ antiporter